MLVQYTGITNQGINPNAKLKYGVMRNRMTFELRGTINSLLRSFKASAKGCNKPYTPTTEHPILS